MEVLYPGLPQKTAQLASVLVSLSTLAKWAVTCRGARVSLGIARRWGKTGNGPIRTPQRFLNGTFPRIGGKPVGYRKYPCLRTDPVLIPVLEEMTCVGPNRIPQSTLPIPSLPICILERVVQPPCVAL